MRRAVSTQRELRSRWDEMRSSQSDLLEQTRRCVSGVLQVLAGTRSRILISLVQVARPMSLVYDIQWPYLYVDVLRCEISLNLQP